MPRDPLPKLDRPRSFHGDPLGLRSRLFYLPFEQIPAAAPIHTLDVQILHIEAEIRDAPDNPLILSDDHARNTRKRHAGDIESGRAQVNLIPSRWNAPLEMRIVSQNRFAVGCVFSRKRPGVRAWLIVSSNARGKKEVDLCPVAGLEHRGLLQFLTPGCREVAIHLQATEQAICDGPEPRIILEQRKFEREFPTMSLDEVIHATRVDRENRAV